MDDKIKNYEMKNMLVLRSQGNAVNKFKNLLDSSLT